MAENTSTYTNDLTIALKSGLSRPHTNFKTTLTHIGIGQLFRDKFVLRK